MWDEVEQAEADMLKQLTDGNVLDHCLLDQDQMLTPEDIFESIIETR